MKSQMLFWFAVAILPLVVRADESAIRSEPTGPGGGGWLTALAVDRHDSQRVYRGCDVGGFYKSTNGGRTWRIMIEGLTDYYVQDLLRDPERSDVICVTAPGGLFKSMDSGNTWHWKRKGFPDPSQTQGLGLCLLQASRFPNRRRIDATTRGSSAIRDPCVNDTQIHLGQNWETQIESALADRVLCCGTKP